MKTLLSLLTLSMLVFTATFGSEANAITRHTSPLKGGKGKPGKGLAAVCPKIQTFNPSLMFYKNNKPHRASSAINSPVIGYFKQMTLGYNAGKNGPLGSVMYDSKGGRLTSMTPYACRTDHCGGRVVSATQTDTARRAAVSRTHSPTGYIPLGRGVCVKINDIGRCYGNEVDKGRALCNQIVK